MNTNFLYHFLEMHGLTTQFLEEEELYLQDKICAYAHKDTRKALTVWTWQECEESEKAFYATRSI